MSREELCVCTDLSSRLSGTLKVRSTSGDTFRFDDASIDQLYVIFGIRDVRCLHLKKGLSGQFFLQSLLRTVLRGNYRNTT